MGVITASVLGDAGRWRRVVLVVVEGGAAGGGGVGGLLCYAWNVG